jgi:MFS family permease
VRFDQSAGVQVAAALPVAHFLGWRMAFVGFIANFLNTSCTFGAFGVFVLPLAEEFGVSRALITSAPGIAMLLGAPVGIVIGHLADRGPVRHVMFCGVLAMALGLFAIARADALLWIALFFFTLVFQGANFAGPMTAMALVGRWFVKKRGLALGLSVAGSTIATAFAPWAAARLVGELGWRGALDVMAAGALVLGLPVFGYWIVRSPADVGQYPDGAQEPPPEVAAGSVPETAGEFLRSRNFYLMGVAFAFIFSSPIVNALHFVPFAHDLGFTAEQAALPLSALALCSLLGKLVFGVIGDRFDPRRAAALAVSFGSVSWTLLAMQPSYSGLIVAGALMGLGVGAVAPLHGVLAGRCFGSFSIGRVISLGGLIGLPIIAGSGIAAGVLFEWTEGYRVPFAIEAVALALAGLLISLLRLPPLSTTASEADASPLRSPA